MTFTTSTPIRWGCRRSCPTAKASWSGRPATRPGGATVAEEWEIKSLSGNAVHPLDQGDSPQAEDEKQQNLRFQGQYLDRETGLHYNTFRYYDADIGRFISPDPIGLAGGTNLSLYGGNTQGWIDPLGLKGELWGGPGQPSSFGEWFNNASPEQVRDAMANPATKEQITGALRNGGGMHEWFPVSMAEKAKEFGFTVEELKKLSTPTGDVWFQNVPDPRNPGAVLEGPHSTGKKLPAGQSGRASSAGHDILMGSLEGATSKRSAIARIRAFADRFVRGGRSIIGKQC